MIVRIKEGKSLDKFLELADKYIEKASKKDVDKKVIIVTLLSRVLALQLLKEPYYDLDPYLIVGCPSENDTSYK
ncbi:MAG: hypothetical protein A4E25_00868 [Methanobacterium sp. PtaB.Bin024]|nr:MAG: hypothetical protein A4E25_00868 [Methanobacterium sp. PtaB.Bin024]